MSAVTINGELVHYEVLGRGRPVLLLHGWLGSWRYWTPTLQYLQGKFRVYALDLFGFGDSAKNPQHYSIDQQVLLIEEFMKQMGLPKAALVGHGLGAQVAAEFAARFPDRVARLMAISAPLYDVGELDKRAPKRVITAVPAATASSFTTVLAAPPAPKPEPALAAVTVGTTTVSGMSAAMRAALLDIARARSTAGGVENLAPVSAPTSPTTGAVPTPLDDKAALAAAAQPAEIPTTEVPAPAAAVPNGAAGAKTPLATTLEAPLDALLGRCFKRSEIFYDKLSVDVVKADARAVAGSVNGFDAGLLLDTFRILPMPVVIVHGVDDPLIPAPNEDVWNYLTTDKEHALLPIPLPQVRHFPMLEYELFPRLIEDFLEAQDISRIAVKERWRRRTR